MSAQPGEPSERGSSPFCFPRARRVRKRREFVAVQAAAPRVTTPHFVLLVGRTSSTDGAPPGPARLGVTASRQLGGAVERNRVKRLVREAFRLDPSWLPEGVDLVVIARKGAEALALGDVQREWARVRGLVRRRAGEALAAPPRGSPSGGAPPGREHRR